MEGGRDGWREERREGRSEVARKKRFQLVMAFNTQYDAIPYTIYKQDFKDKKVNKKI